MREIRKASTWIISRNKWKCIFLNETLPTSLANFKWNDLPDSSWATAARGHFFVTEWAIIIKAGNVLLFTSTGQVGITANGNQLRETKWCPHFSIPSKWSDDTKRFVVAELAAPYVFECKEWWHLVVMLVIRTRSGGSNVDTAGFVTASDDKFTVFARKTGTHSKQRGNRRDKIRSCQLHKRSTLGVLQIVQGKSG